jgi:hypothetical protein
VWQVRRIAAATSLESTVGRSPPKRTPEDSEVRTALGSTALTVTPVPWSSRRTAEHAKEFGIELPMPTDCATALLSLGVGLGVQRAIDPEVGVEVLRGVIRLFAGG